MNTLSLYSRLCAIAAVGLTATSIQADILIADFATQSVKRFTTDGVFVEDFVTPGDGGLINIRGMNFGSEGNLYVADNTSGTSTLDGVVRRYDGTTGAYIDDFIGGPPPDGTTGSSYVAFDAAGNLYHNDSATVRKYDPSGVLVDPMFVPLLAANQFAWSPADGKFYIYDTFQCQIDRFLADGTLDADGLVSPTIEPFSFAIDSAGNIYVPARPNVGQNYLLYKYNQNGTLLATSCQDFGTNQVYVGVGPDDVPFVVTNGDLSRVNPDSPTLESVLLSTTPGMIALDILVIGPSGPPPPSITCRSDIDGDGVVDVNDLVQVIVDWGPCSDCP